MSRLIGSEIRAVGVSFSVRHRYSDSPMRVCDMAISLTISVDRLPVPCVLPTIRADFTKATPRAGILQLAFDNDATLLLIRLETSPHVIHIHTFLPTPNAASPMITHLTSLIFTHPVKNAKWSPSGARRLAVTTRSGAVYFWDAEGAWVDDGAEEARGGMMEGVGVPSRECGAALGVEFAIATDH